MMMTKKTLTIGKLAKAANVNVDTVRYYQDKGLISSPSKPKGGFRTYSEQDILRIRFIKKAQQLGFTLREISQLLNLGSSELEEVMNIAREKVADIDERLSTLKSMQNALKKFLKNFGQTDNKSPGLYQTVKKSV